MILDRSTLITGSFNFTKAAEEKNAENLLILKGNKTLVDRFIRNFEEHKRHFKTGRGDEKSPRWVRFPCAHNKNRQLVYKGWLLFYCLNFNVAD